MFFLQLYFLFPYSSTLRAVSLGFQIESTMSPMAQLLRGSSFPPFLPVVIVPFSSSRRGCEKKRPLPALFPFHVTVGSRVCDSRPADQGFFPKRTHTHGPTRESPSESNGIRRVVPRSVSFASEYKPLALLTPRARSRSRSFLVRRSHVRDPASSSRLYPAPRGSAFARFVEPERRAVAILSRDFWVLA